MQQPVRPIVPRPATLDGPAGPLEARIEDPAPGERPRACGVLCHPHPLYGGTMQNKVVHTLGRAMQELGVPTLRFNFRGVGGSAGSYDAGVGEVDDALAACDWAQRHWGTGTLWLAGFSFGAAVALTAAASLRCAALVTVAPPVGRIIVASVARPDCPWLVVQGDRDELVDVAAVRHWAARLAPPPRLAELAGAEHFFHGRLVELRRVVGEFLADTGAA